MYFSSNFSVDLTIAVAALFQFVLFLGDPESTSKSSNTLMALFEILRLSLESIVDSYEKLVYPGVFAPSFASCFFN
eukprot:CAMPEP_0170489402 /NCGR_PEP_ID=MMETSP0208-20121228/7757_1 /TAXON_ID=197538 /ORGANISM="Strombidium inclinatum, Strain S3" /LENGTH=75 /DNA_ID=CAMNT_0010764303 /DNA_START=121 /DNA_END=348 /DNA_ORIENTATION=-